MLICVVSGGECIALAETKLIENSADSLLFQNFIIRQFEKVLAILKTELETAAGSEVADMDSIIGKNNIRFLIKIFTETYHTNNNRGK